MKNIMRNLNPTPRTLLVLIFVVGILARLAFVVAPFEATHIDAERADYFRALSALFSIAALFAFFRVARCVLEFPGALAASALFAINPVLIALSGSLLPDGLMLLLSLLSILSLFAWEASEKTSALLAASAWLALAILAKASAVHLGFFFAFIVLRKLGARALRTPQIYVSACIVLAPALVWYGYANGLWHSAELSFFVQDDAPFARADAWRAPWTLLANRLAVESRYVFNGPGFVLLGMVFLQPARRASTLLAWYASALLFHCFLLETPGSKAYLHHAIGVAPACILLGAGVMTFLDPQNIYRIATRTTDRAARIAALFLLVPTLLLCAHRGYVLLAQRVHQEKPHSQYDGRHKVDPSSDMHASALRKTELRSDALKFYSRVTQNEDTLAFDLE